MPKASGPVALSRSLAYAARELATVLGGSSLASRRFLEEAGPLRAEVHELLLGTLRRYGEGDAIIARLADRRLDLPVRALLLVALYRLVTDPATAHTTVDQAVDAAALCDCARAGGLINGVLRNFQRRRPTLLADIASDPVVVTAHPAWWLERLQAAYPDAWPAIVEADNRQPPITLRINQRRQSVADAQTIFEAAGLEATIPAGGIDAWPAALRIGDPGPIDRLPGYREGHFSVQDPAAQRAACLLNPQSGQRILDACAAPGGKAAHLLELADIDLTAVEIDPQRASRVAGNLARLGLSATIITADATAPEPWWDGQPFDAILIDAPCTATGVVRRYPDAKWLRREEDIAGFAAQQSRLLAALWPLLAVGGRLLYATCSVFPEENEGQIAAFLAAHPDAACLVEEQWLPSAEHDGFHYALLGKR